MTKRDPGWRVAQEVDFPAVAGLIWDGYERHPRPGDIAPVYGETFQREVWITDDSAACFVIYFVRDTGRWTGHSVSNVVASGARGRGLGRATWAQARVVSERFSALRGGRMRVFGYAGGAREVSQYLFESEGWLKLSEPVEGGSALWCIDVGQ